MYIPRTVSNSSFLGVRAYFLWVLQICCLISVVASKYNPDTRHYEENFDPNEADPRKNISCVGNSYDLKLPLIHGFNPNGLSMQQICAKPQYGGGGRHQHAGGYCYYPLNYVESKGADETTSNGNDTSEDESSSDEAEIALPQVLQGMLRGQIIFDNHGSSEPNRQLQNPRVLQACLYRCFCNYGLDDVSVQPLSDHLPVRTWPSIDGYQLQIDVNDDFTQPYNAKRGQMALRNVDSVAIYKNPQVDRLGLGYIARPSHMNLNPGNEIECGGSLPTFTLPPPFAREDFFSVKELCAVTLSGGNKDANAGGYCHRSASGLPGVENTVWFSDSMTPRHDWTWGGGNFYATANIRFYCWRRCRCKWDPPRDPDSSKFWHVVTGLKLGLLSDGSVNMESSGQLPQPELPPWQQQQQHGQGKSSSTSWPIKVQILPPQPAGVNDSASGTCGTAHNEFCPKQWDTAAWGPIPHEPPNVTDIVKPSPPKAGVMGVCGNRCSTQQDCGTTDERYTCKCAFPSDSDARVLGLDPVAPVAVCIALLASAVGVGGKSGLGGRDVDEVSTNLTRVDEVIAS